MSSNEGSIIHPLLLLPPPLFHKIFAITRSSWNQWCHKGPILAQPVHPLTPFPNVRKFNRSLEFHRKTKRRILAFKQSGKHSVFQRIHPVRRKNNVHVALCMRGADIGPSIPHQPVWILPCWLFSRLLDSCSAESPFLNIPLSCCGLFPHSLPLPPVGNKSVFP